MSTMRRSFEHRCLLVVANGNSLLELYDGDNWTTIAFDDMRNGYSFSGD